MEELRTYTAKQLSAVKDFGVKCENVGEVTWPGLSDVRFLDLDEVIQFSKDAKGRAKVSFYSNQDTENGELSKSPCPAIGEGLNRPCVITLIGFKPPSDRKAKKMLKRISKATEDIGGELINYDSLTGAWTFALEKVC
mgnify:FL=1